MRFLLFLIGISIATVSLCPPVTTAACRSAFGPAAMGEDFLKRSVAKIIRRANRPPKFLNSTSIKEFAPHLRATFGSVFPKRSRRFESAERNRVSIRIHKSILDRSAELDAKGWPYDSMLNFFYVSTKYLDADAFELDELAEITGISDWGEGLSREEDHLILMSLQQFPDRLILPFDGLSDVRGMNLRASWGIHASVFSKKRLVIDGNPFETRLGALGHDHIHFQQHDQRPDYMFWRQLMQNIEKQKDETTRSLMHAMVFEHWHELNGRLSRIYFAEALGGIRLLSSVQEAIKSGFYGGRLKTTSQARLEDAAKTMLRWMN